MAELLLELLSEEIPARMQARAAEDLKRLVGDALVAAGLATGGARAYVTPRRLTVVVDDVPAKSADVDEERKGPRVGAPDAAVQGFLKAAGLASLDQASVVDDAKKGSYYVARISRPGRTAAAILEDVIPDIVGKFPWPKSMRQGTSKLRWVRPLQAVLCLFDGRPVRLTIDGVDSVETTRGHRFLSPRPFVVTDFSSYDRGLADAHVILDPQERADRIADDARDIAEQHGLELIEDAGLLAENAGLVEWPSVMMGSFDKSFLEVPAEVLTTAMKAHQKCFSLRDPETGKLANRFLLVSNASPRDGGKTIIAGNEKVIRARLADAKFFWELDRKKPLDEMWSSLRTITFHDKLGTQFERVERITALAGSLAGVVDAPVEDARRAAQLAKADLVSGVVGEFPELQGVIGRYLAEAARAKPEIARAIEEHYRPKGPSDRVPAEPVSVAVALADKIDQLAGFWAIGEKPTGSGDPYQLRRAALGVIRILIENDLRLPLRATFERALQSFAEPVAASGQLPAAVASDLMAFFIDRLKVFLRDFGARHDLIDAVVSLPGQDDVALIVHRVHALSEFLKTDDGSNLIAGVKRASNILAIEEKKDSTSHAGGADAGLLQAAEERVLHQAIIKVAGNATAAIDVENFRGAMAALAELRAPVDAFFDKVTVNAEEPALRRNRLALLSQIRSVTMTIADLSRIEG